MREQSPYQNGPSELDKSVGLNAQANPRALRGQAIAQMAGQIEKHGDIYLVQSQSGRGFYRVTPILRGFQIFRNYIRPHEGLSGRTPAEACGIQIQGENKWLTLIQNAKLAGLSNVEEPVEKYPK